jgi:galactokinase
MEIKSIIETAEALLHSSKMTAYFAPGRVNLIGEHLDYNGGLVLPCPLDIGITGVASSRTDGMVRCYSKNYPEKGIIEFPIQNLVFDPAHGWANYVKGMLLEMKATQGLDLYVSSNLPVGAGLSSSAALEILVGIMVNDLENQKRERIDLVKMAQKAENRFIGVQCGIMDQFVIGLAEPGSAMLLDTKTLQYQNVKIDFGDYALIIGNTNKVRALSDSKYNQRRKECEIGLKNLRKELNIADLCEIDETTLLRHRKLNADEAVFRRVRHVVTENERVKKAFQALKKDDLLGFGSLLYASHHSLKEDYEVTGPELDALVASFRDHGAIGARMTGAGFGGCMIALVKISEADLVLPIIGKEYKRNLGINPDFYFVKIGKGAGKYGY